VRASGEGRYTATMVLFGSLPGSSDDAGVLLLESIAQCGAVVFSPTSATRDASRSSAASSELASDARSFPAIR